MSRISNEKIALANERAAEANERASNNEKEAAQLRKLAEDERLARVKIEEKLAWRNLSAEQWTRLIAKLQAFAGQPFEVTTYMDDPEAVNFATIMLNKLVSSGWNHVRIQQVLGFRLFVGVVVHVASSRASDFRNAAETLASALIAEGITAEVKMLPEEGTHSNIMQIFIGKKP
jgi:hypothetical protein